MTKPTLRESPRWYFQNAVHVLEDSKKQLRLGNHIAALDRVTICLEWLKYTEIALTNEEK